MVPARTLRVHAEGMAPTERFKKLRRQMAAGKKEYNLVVPFHGAFWS